jgi:hypothetical protein
MLYNFAPDTSSKADTTSKVNLAAAGADREMPAPKPVPAPLTSEAAATSRTREQGSANSAAGQFGFDAYVFDHKNNIKTGATVTAAAGYGDVYGGSSGSDAGRGVGVDAETVKDDQTFFTPSELKMLLLNFENLTREEQDNLTQYVQRHGMPAASAPAHGMPAASAPAHGMPASAPAAQDSLFSRLVGQLPGQCCGSGIRGFFDPGWKKNPDTGSVVNISDHIFESIVTRFICVKSLKILDAEPGFFCPWIRDLGYRIRDGAGSGINILDPQHWFRQNALFVKLITIPVFSVRIRNLLDFHSH